MKNKKTNYIKIVLLLGFVFAFVTGCEREISDEVEFATFSDTAEVFIDAPIGLGSNFYFPYGPDANNPVGSKPTAWSVDEEISYEGSASMRIDVPNADDPEGNYAGAILRIDGPGRDLSSFDALTFWAKASQGVNIGEIGFGEDFDENKFVANLLNVSLSTKWTKYIIPFPDASKLTGERGVFRYSAGSINGLGYTFWIDELQFEKLGNIAQPRPAILNGEDVVQQAFVNTNILLEGLTQTFNLASGVNSTVFAAPSYFKYTSTDVDVARVSESGVVSVVGTGSATITATLGDVSASGSLTIESSGALATAPEPMLPAGDVISIFSNSYTNVAIDFFNANWAGSTTQTTDIISDGDDIKFYSQNNFVGIGFENPVINGASMTHLHLDIYTDEAISGNIEIQIRDRGANGEINSDFNGFPTVDDKDKRYAVSSLPQGQWTSVDIPLDGNLASQKDNLALIVFVGGPNFYVDNIYFYKQ